MRIFFFLAAKARENDFFEDQTANKKNFIYAWFRKKEVVFVRIFLF